MSWDTITGDQIQVGDRVRARGAEFVVARIDRPFLGRAEMICLVEDTPEQWRAYPVQLAGEVERFTG